jgi:hypothetical protein
MAVPMRPSCFGAQKPRFLRRMHVIDVPLMAEEQIGRVTFGRQYRAVAPPVLRKRFARQVLVGCC